MSDFQNMEGACCSDGDTSGSSNSRSFSDAVPIKVNKVYDSCNSRDCLDNLRVTGIDHIPAGTIMVKSRGASIKNVCVNIEPIQFNKGFYSVDITYTIAVDVAFYGTCCTKPLCRDTGYIYANKHCILYGGEGNTQTFCNNASLDVGSINSFNEVTNLPTACVHAINPIVLECKLATSCVCKGKKPRPPKKSASSPEMLGGEQSIIPNVCCSDDDKIQQTDVIITLGLFSIVELTRPTTILVPTYPYTIPKKECCNATKSPCEIFDKMKFPTDEFVSASNSYEPPIYPQCTTNSINSIENDSDDGCCCSCD